MSLQDDFFDLDADLKGWRKRKLRKIWRRLCEAEQEAKDAEDCVRLVNGMRNLLCDRPPMFTRKQADSMQKILAGSAARAVKAVAAGWTHVHFARSVGLLIGVPPKGVRPRTKRVGEEPPYYDLTAPIERDVAEKNLREIIEEWERVPKDMEVAKTRAAALESAVKVGTLLYQAEEIITSERSWDDKYDLIFSDSISSEFQRLMPDFTWYDPDTSYEEDVRSWFEAAKRYGRDPHNHPTSHL